MPSKFYFRSRLGIVGHILIPLMLYLITLSLIVNSYGDRFLINVGLSMLPLVIYFLGCLRSYRPSRRILLITFPWHRSTSENPGQVTIHHRLLAILVNIVLRFCNPQKHHLRSVRISRKLLRETVDFTEDVLARGYDSIKFASVHLNDSARLQQFTELIHGRIPGSIVTVRMTRTSWLWRLLLRLSSPSKNYATPEFHHELTIASKL
ncbi:hypothetical protein DFR42_101542 [Undibacterium pigrum]|uniref:Uncharacterized protein n=1 Tax=Undibacterium pigrum TaxID=401470 RepID=A0A318JEI1_9BURK|nr:hypothetical protein DFR42_101542 [Undibacterium pigrum]